MKLQGLQGPMRKLGISKERRPACCPAVYKSHNSSSGSTGGLKLACYFGSRSWPVTPGCLGLPPLLPGSYLASRVTDLQSRPLGLCASPPAQHSLFMFFLGLSSFRSCFLFPQGLELSIRPLGFHLQALESAASSDCGPRFKAGM